MTFPERCKHVAFRTMTRLMHWYIFEWKFRAVQLENNIDPSSSVTALINRAKLWIEYSSLALDYPEPSMPNTVKIGGMAVKNSNKLPKVFNWINHYHFFFHFS